MTVTRAGVALDLSSATGSLYFHSKTRAGVAVTTNGTATFTGTGSDGKIRHTVTASEVGSVRELVCEFEVQGYQGGNLVTYPFILRVVPRAKI